MVINDGRHDEREDYDEDDIDIYELENDHMTSIICYLEDYANAVYNSDKPETLNFHIKGILKYHEDKTDGIEEIMAHILDHGFTFRPSLKKHGSIDVLHKNNILLNFISPYSSMF